MPTDYIPNGYQTIPNALSFGESLDRLISFLPDGRVVFVANSTTTPVEAIIWAADGTVSIPGLDPTILSYTLATLPSTHSVGALAWVTDGPPVGLYFDNGVTWNPVSTQAIKTYTLAGLPTAGVTGRLAYVTNGNPVGVYVDNGTTWVPLFTNTVLPAYAFASLPTAATAGKLARVTDNIGGVWMDGGAGNQWRPIGGSLVDATQPPFNLSTSASAGANSAALQAAINAAVSVYIPDGSYNYDTQLNLKSNFELLCAPNAILNYTGSGKAISCANTYNLRVKGLQLVGNALATDGLYVAGMTHSSIEDITITGFTNAASGRAVYLHGANAAGIYYNRFARWQLGRSTAHNNYGLYTDSEASPSKYVNANTFLDVAAIYNNADAVYLSDVAELCFLGGSIEQNVGYGFNISNSQQVHIFGNYMEANLAGKITVADAVITAGDQTVTSASLTLTDADIGRGVTLTGAGAGATNVSTTIASINSGTSFEVAVAGASIANSINPATIAIEGFDINMGTAVTWSTIMARPHTGTANLSKITGASKYNASNCYAFGGRLLPTSEGTQFTLNHTANLTDYVFLSGHADQTANFPFALTAQGSMEWGDHTNPRDIVLSRLAANQLRLAAGDLLYVDRVHYAVLAAEPATPTDGDVAYANGTGWNPGGGAGLYVRSGGAWVKLH